MDLRATLERLVERAMVFAGVAPIPLIDTFHTVIAARGIMVASKLGVFDAVGARPITGPELARRVGAHPVALQKLLGLLVATGYLRFRAGRYRPTRIARKWLLATAESSLHDNMLLRFLEWRALEDAETFVRTGRGLDVHQRIGKADWAVYQRGMRALARLSAPEVVRRLPLVRNPVAMLDIGGGHGVHAAELCRRYPGLRATILDLPSAVEAAAPLLAEEGVGERIVHRAGDALTDDLGERIYDLVFMSHLVHHFDAATNARLMRRAAAALRPGGVLAILDVLRPRSPHGSMNGAVLDLYFGITSNSGCWARDEMEAWLASAGLGSLRVCRLETAPGLSVITATRPA